MPAKEGTLPVAIEKRSQKFPDDYVVINIPDSSVVFVPMNDYVLVENDPFHKFQYLESYGAGTCVNIAIRGGEKTLLAHMPEDTNAQGKGTRAGQNQHEILSAMLDLVSQDRSQIEAIGLTGGQGFKAGMTTLTREVLDDLLGREDLNCDVNVIARVDMLVEIATGAMYGLNVESADNKFTNTVNSKFDGYPEGIEHGKILDLFADDDENSSESDNALNDAGPDNLSTGDVSGTGTDETDDTGTTTDTGSNQMGEGDMMDDPMAEEA